jgi:hypothetical protein
MKEDTQEKEFEQDDSDAYTIDSMPSDGGFEGEEMEEVEETFDRRGIHMAI